MTNVKWKEQSVQQLREGTVDLKSGLIEIGGQQYRTEELSYDVLLSGTVYGALLNYKGAYSELESSMHDDPYKAPPKGPILYIKPVNTLTGYGTSIPLPEGVLELEIGAALGVVIGKTATRVTEEEALDYVAGYTIVNDVSIPHNSVYRPAIKEKARDGFCPSGPWIVERDSVDNPNDLRIRVSINGELKQENTTANLVRPIAKLLADVTEFMTLSEGDTLLVGVPEHAPLAKENDTVQIEIEGIGTLENKVTSEKVLVGGEVV